MPRIPRAAALAASLTFAAAAAAAPSARPADSAKTEYRVYLLVRDPVRPANVPDKADPIYGLAGDVRHELETLGATLEKRGTFGTPTADGGARDNDVSVYRAAWTTAEYEKAVALAREADLLQIRIEPAAALARHAGAGGAPASAADVVGERIRRQIGISLPPALLTGDARAFDGSVEGRSIVEDYSNAAARLQTPLRLLPTDPAELARRLGGRAAPAPRGPAEVPSPLPSVPASGLKYDAVVARAAAEKGVDPEILRGLLFAAQGYSGGFAPVTGLHGPMGLSLASGRDYGLDAATIEDPAANIAAGAAQFKALLRQFRGNLSRSVAAFYCGSGRVRRSGGIPADCAGYLSQFYLAYQNGAAWAVDHDAPRTLRPPAPTPEPVSRTKAVADAVQEDVDAALHGDTPPNRPWHSRIMPPELISRIAAAAARNYFDPSVRVDPDVLVGLSWAEGGFSSANKRPNEWGAVGPMQVTYSGAEPHCREKNARGKLVYDWRDISKWNDPKNVQCGAKVFYDRVQWTATKDPVIGLALYNTQQKHWAGIIAKNKVPAFPETVSYVVRAATIACARSGKMILTPQHFENARAVRLAKAEEKRLVRDEFPYEGNEVPDACRIFR